MKGRVSAFQSLGTVDGPSVRFVVFMQGCPLRCKCCHNPETWAMDGGTAYTAEEIVSKVLRYRHYFGTEGGITLSGGEPLMQAEFAAEVFAQCKAQGITTCLDTSGCVLNEAVQRVLDHTDTVLLDYKMTNAEDYHRFTGMQMEQAERFLENLERRGIRTWLRQVIVGGWNDNAESVQKLYGKRDKYSCVEKVELLPFRKICMTKYEELGIKFPLADTPETSQRTIEVLTQSSGYHIEDSKGN